MGLRQFRMVRPSGGHNQRRPIRWLSRAHRVAICRASPDMSTMTEWHSARGFWILHSLPCQPATFPMGLVCLPLIHWHKNLEGSRGRQSRPGPALHQVVQKPGIAPRAAHSVGHAPCCRWLVLTASTGARTSAHTDTPPQPTHHPVLYTWAASRVHHCPPLELRPRSNANGCFLACLRLGWTGRRHCSSPCLVHGLTSTLCRMPLDWQRQRQRAG